MLKKIIIPCLFLGALTACSEQKNTSAESKADKATTSSQPEVLSQNVDSVKNSPIDQVYKSIQDFSDFRTLEITQEFDSPESSKSKATVTLTRGGLADDSVTAERETYQFEYENGIWKEKSKEKSWKCGRGDDTTTFHTKLCP